MLLAKKLILRPARVHFTLKKNLMAEDVSAWLRLTMKTLTTRQYSK